MENQEFQLGTYLTSGVEKIVKGAIRATLTDPRESAFMARFALSSREASRRRAQAEKDGKNIPPFLIASITSACNLHCAGCYSRQNHACVDAEPVDQLTGEDWKNIFAAAVVSMLWHVSIEGWLGAVISVVILKAGAEILMDSLSGIIGARVDSELSPVIFRWCSGQRKSLWSAC